MNKTIIYFGLLWFIVNDAHAVGASGKLLFHSGLEPDTRLVNESSGWIDIVGVDRSVKPPNDWTRHFHRGPLGTFRFQYAGGDTSKRRVTIGPDPTNSSNHVLRYWMRHVNVKPNASYGGKGRIQVNVAGNKNLKNFYYRIRLYFHSDWQYLQNWQDKMGWFILAEFWNNANWTREGYPFRIHITISNNPGSDDGLQFGVGAQIDSRGWKGIWHESNKSFSIPLEQWLTAEIYLKEGKDQKGRFYFAVTEQNGDKTIIADVRKTTHHPDDPSPDGFTQFNPMKLYTHNKNIHRVRDQGGALQVYWDDFELWTDKTP